MKDLGSTNGTFIGALRVREVLVTSPVDLTLGQSKVHVEPSKSHRVDVGFADKFGPLVQGASPKMCGASSASSIGSRNTPLSVLILGETGTEARKVLSRSSHPREERATRGRDGPFVVVDCGSIPPTPRREHPLRGTREGVVHGRERAAQGGARGGGRRDALLRRARRAPDRAPAQAPARARGAAGEARPAAREFESMDDARRSRRRAAISAPR